MEKFNEKFSGYYDYFENIRKRIFSLAVVFAVFFVAGFFEAGNILRMIMSVFNLRDATIVTTSPFQFLDLATKVGLYTGLIVCLPLLIYHLYDFLKDGLNRKEKRLFFVLLPIGLALFAAGFAYCFTILYFYINSVSALNLAFGIKNIWDVSSFMSQIILASVCLGLVFQFPIVLTFLIRVGLIKVSYLREKRFYAIAGIFIFVGFLPPPDIFSTILEALPLIVLYQMTIWVNSAYFLGRKSSAVNPTASSMKITSPTFDAIKTAT
jgi:sec-independent protein translocase protein TatC